MQRNICKLSRCPNRVIDFLRAQVVRDHMPVNQGVVFSVPRTGGILSLPDRNPNYVASQMGHSDAQMVYRVYGAWMSENNTDQLSLINTKMSDLVLHTFSTKVAV